MPRHPSIRVSSRREGPPRRIDGRYLAAARLWAIYRQSFRYRCGGAAAEAAGAAVQRGQALRCRSHYRINVAIVVHEFICQNTFCSFKHAYHTDDLATRRRTLL